MNSFLFLFFVPIIGTVQSSSILYIKIAMSVRAKFDAWKEGAASTEVRRDARRVPRSRARGKKRRKRAAERRARTKRREKNISAGAKARERKKNIIQAGAKKRGGSEKIILFSGAREKKNHLGGSEKNSGVNENTTHKKTFTYSMVETSFFYLFLSGVDYIYWKELWYNH